MMILYLQFSIDLISISYPNKNIQRYIKRGNLGYFELFASKGHIILEQVWQAKSIKFLENNVMAYITDLLSAKKECFEWKIHWNLKFLRGQTPPRNSRAPIYPKLRSKIP